MAFSYDLTTDVGKVRRTIPDRDSTAAFFQDEELESLIAEEGSVKRAAAAALEIMASDEAYIKGKIRLLDLSTDGPAVSAELRARARDLRAQDDEDDLASGGAFAAAEQAVDLFSTRNIIYNRRLRNGS